MGNVGTLEACYIRDRTEDEAFCVSRAKQVFVGTEPKQEQSKAEKDTPLLGSVTSPLQSPSSASQQARGSQLSCLSWCQCCWPLSGTAGTVQRLASKNRLRTSSSKDRILTEIGGPKLFPHLRREPSPSRTSKSLSKGELSNLIAGGRFMEVEGASAASHSQGPSMHLTPKQKRIVHRVAKVYKSSTEDFLQPDESKDAWVFEEIDETLSFKFHAVGDIVYAVITMEFDSIDPARLVAALLETDLCHSYRPSLLNVSLLDGQQGSSDALWHVLQSNVAGASGGNEDLIWHSSVVDALEEDGFLWVGFYSADLCSPEMEAMRNRLPEVSQGDSRIESTLTTIVEPRLRGATASMAGMVRVAGISSKMLSVAPNFLLRRFIRELVVIPTAAAFKQHAETSEELTQRLSAAQAGSLYSQVRRKLREHRARVYAARM